MLLVAADRAAIMKCFDVCKKWGLWTRDGKGTSTGRPAGVKDHGRWLAEIPNRELADEAPLYDSSAHRAAAARAACKVRASRAAI